MKALLIFLSVAIIYVFWSGFRNSRRKSKESANSNADPLVEPAVQNTLELPPQRTIADYFNADILNLISEDYQERVTLPVPEMGVFPFVDTHYNDGSVSSVEFISLSKRFTPELIEFINDCSSTFGLTKTNEGNVTPQDEALLLRGRFSRLWKDVWLECGPDENNGGLTALRLTIFNPSVVGKTIITK